MRLIAKILLVIILNTVIFYVAVNWITGVFVSGGLVEFALLGLVLAVLNFFLKPILKLILGPIIVLTLGLGLILVNALILGILDFLSVNLTIQGYSALLYLAILTSVVNFVYHFATKN